MIVDFTPANDLEQTLVRAATDPAARPEFYRRLLAAELYIVTEEGRGADADEPASKPTALDADFITWESPKGPYVPLFSSRARIDEIAKLRERSYGFVALIGKAAFARLAQEKRTAFLNPGFASGKQFGAEVIERLAGGEKSVPQRDTAETTRPSEPPEDDGEKKPWWKIW